MQTEEECFEYYAREIAPRAAEVALARPAALQYWGRAALSFAGALISLPLSGILGDYVHAGFGWLFGLNFAVCFVFGVYFALQAMRLSLAVPVPPLVPADFAPRNPLHWIFRFFQRFDGTATAEQDRAHRQFDLLNSFARSLAPGLIWHERWTDPLAPQSLVLEGRFCNTGVYIWRTLEAPLSLDGIPAQALFEANAPLKGLRSGFDLLLDSTRGPHGLAHICDNPQNLAYRSLARHDGVAAAALYNLDAPRVLSDLKSAKGKPMYARSNRPECIAWLTASGLPELLAAAFPEYELEISLYNRRLAVQIGGGIPATDPVFAGPALQSPGNTDAGIESIARIMYRLAATAAEVAESASRPQ